MKPHLKILAMHFGALGDFVISWPALGRLAHAAELHLWGRPEWGRLVLPPGQVHDREAARFASLFSGRLDPAVQEWLCGFERVAVFAHRPPADLLTGLDAVLPGKVWLVPTRPQKGESRHAGLVQLEALAGFGLKDGAPLSALNLSRAPRSRAIIAPGSGGKAKRLPVEVVRRAYSAWEKRGLDPVLLLGPAEERDYRLELNQALAAQQPEFFADPPVPALAAALAAAPEYLGADSGVSHLAAACGTVCLVGFGPSDPVVWAPAGDKVRILSFVELKRYDFAAPEWI